MRVLLDTNVLVAAFLTHGACAEVFERCAKQHTLIGSEQQLAELRKALGRKLKMPARDVDEVEALLRTRMEMVAVEPLPKAVCRDAADDGIIAAAWQGRCRCLVTGDKDLLVLCKYRGLLIISPGQFWALEAKAKRSAS